MSWTCDKAVVLGFSAIAQRPAAREFVTSQVASDQLEEKRPRVLGRMDATRPYVHPDAREPSRVARSFDATDRNCGSPNKS